MGIVVSKLWQCIKRGNVNNQALYTSEIKSYLAACETDLELKAFDTKMQRRMTKAMSSLTEGVDIHSISFDSLKEVTGCLCMMNQEVVKVILNCRQDIWNTPDLFELVEDYFKNSLQTLEFFAVLKKCLVKAKDSHLILQVALQCFRNDDRDYDSTNKHERTLEELKRFKETCNPFNEFFQTFNSVYGQQQLMIEKLMLRKLMLNKRLKTIKAFRRISSIIFASAYTALVICSVVAAAMASPAVAAALSAATSEPLGSMGKWFDSLWEKYENTLKSQRDAVASMQAGTFVVIKDLESVRVLIERLEVRIGALLQSAEFAFEEDEGVGIAVCEISKMLEGFVENVEETDELAARCCRDIRWARTVVLQRILG